MTSSPRRTATVTAIGFVGCLLLASCSNTPVPTASPVAGISSTVSSSSPTGGPTSAEAVESSSPTSVAQTGTACTLITEKDVTGALGEDPGPGNGAVRTKGSTCAYGGTTKYSVNVTMVPAGGKAAYDSAKSLDPTADAAAVDVPGVGDAAFGIFHAPFATVEFYKGNAFVSLMVSSTIGDTSVTPKDQAVALATVAAGRA